MRRKLRGLKDNLWSMCKCSLRSLRSWVGVVCQHCRDVRLQTCIWYYTDPSRSFPNFWLVGKVKKRWFMRYLAPCQRYEGWPYCENITQEGLSRLDTSSCIDRHAGVRGSSGFAELVGETILYLVLHQLSCTLPKLHWATGWRLRSRSRPRSGDTSASRSSLELWQCDWWAIPLS